MAKNIRVGELAKELGMTKAEILALCNAMGVNVRSATSTLIEAHAERLRQRAERDGLTGSAPTIDPGQLPGGKPASEVLSSRAKRPPRSGSVRFHELASELGMTNAEMKALSEKMGVRVKSAWSTLIEAEADRLRGRAEFEGLTRPGEQSGADAAMNLQAEGSPSVSLRQHAIGDRVGDRFEVEAVLGSGAFSKVYRVLDTVEGETRALKLFNSAAGYDAVRREINALRKVQHPNVVKVIWADKTEHGDWYLIMEYIDGELLAEYSNGTKEMGDPEAIDVALDVLSALVAMHPDSARLDELHRKNREGELSADEYDELTMMSETALVHRDIKPQNIMLTASGAKLLDFNIASRVGDRVNTVTGTPPYQPPDADLTRWDVTTDLFAVGVTLYELVCHGEHPYPGARPMGGDEPRDPRQFRADLPDQLAAFLLRACSADRDARFDTAAAMKAALEAVRASM